jgi:tRNA threonylcarbamoyladenosine biosynthesis protein TsaE
MTNFEKICITLDDTQELAEKFANIVGEKGAFVSLFGEIGAGKTAFARMVAKDLGVEEKVTSPSFVILNEYHSGKLPIYHFDLYRLENEGVKTIIDELREYSTGKILTFVEWAEFSQSQIPFERIEINVTYEDNDVRKYSFTAFGEENIKLIEELKNDYAGV